MRKSVLTLGTFDGVHRGHQAILSRLVSRARARGAQAKALVFEVPPRLIRKRDSHSGLLTPKEEKAHWLRRMGVGTIIWLRFGPPLSRLSPERFFEEWIVQKHRACEIVVGPRVGFGYRRAGRLSTLVALGRQHGVRVHVVPEIGGRGQVSSRKLRRWISRGDVEAAADGLGRPYSLCGRVIHGEGRGSRLGIPTANVAVFPGKLLPPGVFWVRVSDSRGRALGDGVCNVGRRPTFGGDAEVGVEVMLLRPPQRSLYGRRLTVSFLKRLRREKRFATPEALVRAIARDRQQVAEWTAAGHASAAFTVLSSLK